MGNLDFNVHSLSEIQINLSTAIVNILTSILHEFFPLFLPSEVGMAVFHA